MKRFSGEEWNVINDDLIESMNVVSKPWPYFLERVLGANSCAPAAGNTPPFFNRNDLIPVRRHFLLCAFNHLRENLIRDVEIKVSRVKIGIAKRGGVRLPDKPSDFLNNVNRRTASVVEVGNVG